jgi:hypothetical protein
MKEIVLNWEVPSIQEEARATAMYCFKNCSTNQN